MVEINSVDYLKKVYKCLSGLKNQGIFLVQFFTAAGSNHYSFLANKKALTTQELEGPRHYIKDRPLNTEIKDTFPSPIHKKELVDYLSGNFDTGKIRQSMDLFGIPADADENNQAFALSLVEQFDLFLQSDEEDVDDIVCTEFLKLSQLSDQDIQEQTVVKETKYNGDAVYFSPRDKIVSHDVQCHESFSHEWVIQNYGRAHWKNRRLVLVNQYAKGPRALEVEIAVPETAPGSSIKITASYDARGFEGEYVSKWEMQDENGCDCFPHQSPFDFNITVHYTAKKTEV